MAVTTAETLSVDGVVLNTYAKNIGSLTGRLRAPALRTSNVLVPGRHGALRTPNKKYDQALITLPMWVVGSDDDGLIPGGSTARREFFKRIDELTKLFKKLSGPLDVRHTLPDGTVRQCFAEALDVLDFTTDASPKALFSVNLTVPDVFWQDVSPLSAVLPASGASVAATAFAASSAPMEDLVYRLDGPWTSPRLTFADGSYMAVNQTIPAGQGISVDSGNWDLTGHNGFVPDYTKIEHDGADAYWAALPADNQTITLAGSARTAATQLTITGRRKYLVG